MLLTRSQVQEASLEKATDLLSYLRFLSLPHEGDPTAFIDLRAIWPVNGETYAARSDAGLSPSGGTGFFPMTKSGINLAAAFCLEHLTQKDVMVGVLPRNGRGRSLFDVTACAHLWVEIDGDARLGPASAYRFFKDRQHALSLPNPSLVNYTRKGVHIYYALTDVYPLSSDEDRDKVRSTLLRLAHAVGKSDCGRIAADVATAHAGGILRPSGTLNHKVVAVPAPIQKVLTTGNPETTLRWWRANLPPLPDFEQERRERLIAGRSDFTPGDVSGLPPYAKLLADGCLSGKGRNCDLTTLLGAAVKCNWGDDALLSLMETFCLHSALPIREGQSVYKSALKNFSQRR